ncbi:hypothetical protein BDV10DRAFT_183989 [Aspergillus recurvatus]
MSRVLNLTNQCVITAFTNDSLVSLNSSLYPENEFRPEIDWKVVRTGLPLLLRYDPPDFDIGIASVFKPEPGRDPGWMLVVHGLDKKKCKWYFLGETRRLKIIGSKTFRGKCSTRLRTKQNHEKQYPKCLPTQRSITVMSIPSHNDYQIWIGVVDDHPSLELEEYIVLLHKNNGFVCHWFSAIQKSDGIIKHFCESFSPRSTEHLACERLQKKMFVSHLYEQQLRKFVEIFEETEARKGQFFVFRWLYECVDSGLLREEDVDRVRPWLELEEESARAVDATR